MDVCQVLKAPTLRNGLLRSTNKTTQAKLCKYMVHLCLVDVLADFESADCKLYHLKVQLHWLMPRTPVLIEMIQCSNYLSQ